MKHLFLALMAILLLAGCQQRHLPKASPVPSSAGASAPSQAPAASAPSQAPASESLQEAPLSQPDPEPEPAPEPFSPEGDWSLVLVSGKSPLTQELQVEMAEVEGFQFDKRAAPSLQAMVNDAKDAGFHIQLVSTYRSFATSQQNFDRRVKEAMARYNWEEQEAVAEIGKWVALPGHSEHNTGLAVDLVTKEYWAANGDLYHRFEQEPIFAWLVAHCAEYGFVLRYPEDKQDITDITYEPWHYRYVGPTAAKEMMENGLCLEEYLERKA